MGASDKYSKMSDEDLVATISKDLKGKIEEILHDRSSDTLPDCDTATLAKTILQINSDHRAIRTVDVGSVVLRVSCIHPKSADTLCTMRTILRKMLISAFITEETKDKYALKNIDLNVEIEEKQYLESRRELAHGSECKLPLISLLMKLTLGGMILI